MEKNDTKKTEIKNNNSKNSEIKNNDNNKNDDEIFQNFFSEWSHQHEKILVEWADKAICYRWLHSNAHNTYLSKSRWFTIPVIIMSTLTGTANFAQERIPLEAQGYYSIAVGSINIFAGIITTIQQFLKINELNESHRISSISWDKFYRNIKLELSKARNERIPAYQMLKISKEEFDRLMETSPTIDVKILKKFNDTFSGGPIKNANILNEKQKNFLQLHKPEICDILETTQTFVYKETIEDKNRNKTNKLIDFVNENNEFKKKSIIVNDFINDFSKEFKRQPTKNEIFDNLKDNINNIEDIYNSENVEIKIN